MKTGTTTFRGLFGDGQRVEIPVIQRDYAQGREDERSREVRDRFVKEIADAVLSDDRTGRAPLDLDFVYGKWNATEKILEPLDGQQRLTTLFLLHWYLASLDGAFEEFRAWIAQEHGGSCFTYRTRPAAREFYDALVRQPAPIETLTTSRRAVSEWAADSIWFVRRWRRDPTVRGSLTMLDALHCCFAGTHGGWSRLVSPASPAIVFRLLLLENFGLSDDLYVKMNARGKALTPFEVFKAQLEQFIATYYKSEPCPFASTMTWGAYVSRQLDIAWTDFLWKHRGESPNIDSRFMHLIRAVVLVGCVDEDDDALPKRVDRLLANPEPSLAVYEELGCLGRGGVVTLVRVLDTLARHENAPVFAGRPGYLDEELLFRRVLLARGASQEDRLTLVDWAMFHAWCTFLLRFAMDLGSQSVRDDFHDWMRVVSNLARNSDIDRNERLVAALRGLRKLSVACGPNFLSKVAQGEAENAGGFNQQQQREERIKAQLILRSPAWRPLLERAEMHRYFRGDIEFLLRFSGIFERISKTGRCDWSDAEDETLRTTFADWYVRACAVFPEASTAWPSAFKDFLWERALLAEGDYLLPRGRNWSFLDEKDRDASWKRLLRADTRVVDRDARRDAVRRVLARIDPRNVEASLRAIVSAGVNGSDKTPLPGFRATLVAEPRLVGYCVNRVVRVEDGTAFLLRTSQRNGYHVDLYVYDLYFHLQARLPELAPFDDLTCNETKGTYPPSQVVLRAAALGVAVVAEKHGASMQLQLQLSGPNPELAAVLNDWTANDGCEFARRVSPDLVETVIIELAKLMRLPGAPRQSESERQPG